MDAQNGIIEYQLAARASVVLTRSAGLEVRCHAGSIWLTQYGDDRDIVLRPGQSFVLSLATAVVMSSAQGARLSVQRVVAPAAAAGAPRSLLRRLAGWFDPRCGSAVARQLRGRLAML